MVDSKDRPEMYSHYVVSMCWTCWTFNESNNTETLDQQGNLQIQGFLMNRSCFYFSVPNLNLKFCFKMVGTVSRDLTGLFRWTKFTANYCDTFAAVCAASTNMRKYNNAYNNQTNRIPICVQTQSALNLETINEILSQRSAQLLQICVSTVTLTYGSHYV